MISKFLSRLKSILFKSAVSSETPLKKEKKPIKSAKSSKTKTKAKTKAKTKTKTKTANSKKNIETLTTLPGVGAKSAKALFEAGFKTKEKRKTYFPKLKVFTNSKMRFLKEIRA